MARCAGRRGGRTTGRSGACRCSAWDAQGGARPRRLETRGLGREAREEREEREVAARSRETKERGRELGAAVSVQRGKGAR
jgi:hypothetical protein